jgi:hypothetical protein
MKFFFVVKETFMLLQSNPDPDLDWAGQSNETKIAEIFRELDRIKKQKE